MILPAIIDTADHNPICLEREPVEDGILKCNKKPPLVRGLSLFLFPGFNPNPAKLQDTSRPDTKLFPKGLTGNGRHGLQENMIRALDYCSKVKIRSIPVNISSEKNLLTASHERWFYDQSAIHIFFKLLHPVILKVFIKGHQPVNDTLGR